MLVYNLYYILEIYHQSIFLDLNYTKTVKLEKLMLDFKVVNVRF